MWKLATLVAIECVVATVGFLIVKEERKRPVISSDLISRISLKTLPDNSSPEAIKAREVEVRYWAEYKIGKFWNGWHQNYREHFGRPANSAVSNLSDLTSYQLGKYYLHQPLLREDGVTVSQCVEPSNPTMTAFCALANWDYLQSTGNEHYREEFLRWAAFVRKGMSNDGRWIWTVKIHSRNLDGPWISALTQSIGTSVLLRSYQLTGDSDSMDAATKAASWIAKPLSEGGLSVSDDNGTWFEEYPDPKTPSHVFNGHIWAMFGIFDYYRVTKDEAFNDLFKDGIEALKCETEEYEHGGWITYDRITKEDYVFGLYMQFIVEQMKVLAAITGDDFFLSSAERWDRYQRTDERFVANAAEVFTNSHIQ